MEPGISTQLLRSGVRGAPELVEAALNAQILDAVLASDLGAVVLAGWAPTLSAQEAKHAETIVSRLLAAGAEPPSLEELGSEIGTDAAAILRYLERRGDVIQVEQSRYYAASQVKVLVERVRDAMAGGAELSPSVLRETFGWSRKYLIPFLEYCDRVGYTNRTATGRVWRVT